MAECPSSNLKDPGSIPDAGELFFNWGLTSMLQSLHKMAKFINFISVINSSLKEYKLLWPLWIKKIKLLIWTQIPLLLWCLSKSHDLRRSTLKYFEGEKEFRLSVWPPRVLAQHLAKSLIKLSKEIKYHISKSNTQIWIHFYNFWWFIILNLSHRVKINDKNGLHYFLFFKNFKICPQN